MADAAYCPDPACVRDECSPEDPCCVLLDCGCALADCFTEDGGQTDAGEALLWCRDHEREALA